MTAETFDISNLGGDFSIRYAEPAELRACRMLLPETFTAHRAPEALVALDRDGELAGAAAIGWEASGDPEAFPVAVHVVPAARSHGLGRALLDAVAVLARDEAPALRPWSAPPEDSAAAAFCLATGFTVHHRILHFTGEAERMETMLAAWRERLDRAGWIPAGARVVALPDAPLDEVANLVAREFHNNPGSLLERLRGRAGTPPDPLRSVVLLLDGMVAGAQLVSVAADGIPEVEANVVIPTPRRGWANLLLMHEGTRTGVLHGSRRFRFYCDDRVIDMVTLAQNAGAELTATDLVLRRELTGGEAFEQSPADVMP